MGFRSLCAAAVLAVGVGQAEAAIVLPVPGEDEVITMSLTGIVVANEWRCGLSECNDAIPSASEPIYDAAVGQTQAIYGELFLDGAGYYLALLGFGGSLYMNEVFRDADGIYSGSYTVDDGDPFRLVNLGQGIFQFITDDLEYYQYFEVALDLPQPAPVPLPASAALFPISAAALVFMRRRQVKRR